MTNWKRVSLARDGSGAIARQALSEFCELYWYPLYAYARRTLNTPEDAEDMTQGFFEELLSKGHLDDISAEKGRLRTFLLVSLKHYMSKRWRHDHAEKRGGRVKILSIDQEAAEKRYRFEPAAELSPDLVYERHWATTLLKRVGDTLREEYVAKGSADLFDALQSHLSLRNPERPYTEIGRQFDMTENAVAVTAHRMRRRFRELLRAEIVDTVGSWEDVDDELEHLLRVFS